MDGDNPLECTLCFEEYNEHERRPRNLPCGHTFCSCCILNTIQNSRLTCPNCRHLSYAHSEEQFPISYAMEALIKKLKFSLPQSEQVTQRIDLESISERLASRKREQEGRLRNLIAETQEAHSQIDKYMSQLFDWKAEHVELIAKLKNIIEKNVEEMKHLDDEYQRATEARLELEDTEQQLKTQVMCLTLASTRTEVVAAIEGCYKWRRGAAPPPSRCLQPFPDHSSIFRSAQVRAETGVGVKVMMSIEQEASRFPPLPPPVEPSTIQQKVSHILTHLQAKQDQLDLDNASGVGLARGLMLSRLGGPSQSLLDENKVILDDRVRELLRDGRVYVLQTLNGGERQRSRRLRVERDNIMVGALEDVSPRLNSHTFKFSNLMEMIHPTLPLVYMELSWDGSSKGTIYIRVNASTDLGRQFVQLCTAEKGPTYRNSRFLEVINSGRLGECMYGGDYEYNNGTGGAGISNKRPKAEEFRRPHSGMVVGRWRDDARKAQFGITTKDWSTSMHEVVLGKVETGMTIVQAAVKRPEDIRGVAIVDCGIVVEL